MTGGNKAPTKNIAKTDKVIGITETAIDHGAKIQSIAENKAVIIIDLILIIYILLCELEDLIIWLLRL